jgi:transcriptional regulator with XRE-family HTH domain
MCRIPHFAGGEKVYDWKKIRMARGEAGFSIPELAKASDVSLNTIIRFEKGFDMRASTVRKIAAALGRDIKDFISDEILNGE